MCLGYGNLVKTSEYKTVPIFSGTPTNPRKSIPKANIPNPFRDVSGSAIVALALFELYSYTKKKEYLNYSKKVLEVLKSNKYMLKADVKGPFFFKFKYRAFSC